MCWSFYILDTSVEHVATKTSHHNTSLPAVIDIDTPENQHQNLFRGDRTSCLVFWLCESFTQWGVFCKYAILSLSFSSMCQHSEAEVFGHVLLSQTPDWPLLWARLKSSVDTSWILRQHVCATYPSSLDVFTRKLLFRSDGVVLFWTRLDVTNWNQSVIILIHVFPLWCILKQICSL